MGRDTKKKYKVDRSGHKTRNKNPVLEEMKEQRRRELMILPDKDGDRFMASAPVCGYCGEKTVLADKSDVYKNRVGPIYLCRDCEAWVGCHPGSFRAMGTPADRELRWLRNLCHREFDRRLMSKCRSDEGRARTRLYAWLARKLGIDVADCHFGMFDVDKCKAALNAMGADLMLAAHELRTKRR